MTELVTPDQYDRLFERGIAMLDLRAPVEFQRAALPNSTNLPLLTDAERHEVGRTYKQEGAETALALGHRLVSGELRERRMAAWIDWVRRHPTGVVLCFRGGQRSSIVQQWLHTAAWCPARVQGGYKALRQHLLTTLTATGAKRPLLLLGGRTGTGKTRLLDRIGHSIDLEGAACHRGSAFGQRLQPQPAPATFENMLAAELLRTGATDEQRSTPLVLEDESKLIGRLSLPGSLFENMQQAPIVLIELPLAQRVDITLQDYIVERHAELVSIHGEKGYPRFADWLRGAFHKIRKRLGGVRYQELSAQLEQALETQARSGSPEHHRNWIESLLRDYYDPMYDYQLQTKAERVVFRGEPEAVMDWLHRHHPSALTATHAEATSRPPCPLPTDCQW